MSAGPPKAMPEALMKSSVRQKGRPEGAYRRGRTKVVG